MDSHSPALLSLARLSRTLQAGRECGQRFTAWGLAASQGQSDQPQDNDCPPRGLLSSAGPWGSPGREEERAVTKDALLGRWTGLGADLGFAGPRHTDAAFCAPTGWGSRRHLWKAHSHTHAQVRTPRTTPETQGTSQALPRGGKKVPPAEGWRQGHTPLLCDTETQERDLGTRTVFSVLRSLGRAISSGSSVGSPTQKWTHSSTDEEAGEDTLCWLWVTRTQSGTACSGAGVGQSRGRGRQRPPCSVPQGGRAGTQPHRASQPLSLSPPCHRALAPQAV